MLDTDVLKINTPAPGVQILVVPREVWRQACEKFPELTTSQHWLGYKIVLSDGPKVRS
jgi:hypothetical protein